MQVMREDIDRRAKASIEKATELVTGIPANSSIEIGRVGLGPSPTLMNYDGFREFLAGVTRWAVTDAPTSHKDSTSERASSIYSGHSGRGRSPSLSPWGAGNSEPADHDFMQRLYGKWNKDDNDGLSLQDVVTGLARVKGTTDIMTSISYFFDLYDDDHDGKVDREGILRISEALLFLTRRGLGGSPAPSSISIASTIDDGIDPKSSSADERFLSSVSAFIRRCFEYADPDHPQNQNKTTCSPFTNLNSNMENFTVGDSDSEEDLLDLGPKPASSQQSAPSDPPPAPLPRRTSSLNHTQSRSISKRSANIALDPSNPLHITLPTFRMVILADDLLQQFFESAFPASFHLSDHPAHSPLQTPLTTFSSPTPPALHAAPHGGIVPPAKGLRGVLDNIVSDGMRVAGEVRKRVDEAQREMERNALQRSETDLDDEEEKGVYGGEADRRSVREGDRELLEGEEAVAGVGRGESLQVEEDLLGGMDVDAGSKEKGRIEFER